MKLFEFAIIYVPDAGEAVKKEAKIVVEPRTVLAKDVAAVNLKAAKLIPDEYDSELHNIQVVVRPF